MSATTREPVLVYRGVKQICLAGGLNPNRFTHYRESCGLPVFKTDESSKTWLITHDDLMDWIEERKKIFFGGGENR